MVFVATPFSLSSTKNDNACVSFDATSNVALSVVDVPVELLMLPHYMTASPDPASKVSVVAGPRP